MNKFLVFVIFALFFTQSCGIYKPSDARKVSPDPDERVKKNIEEEIAQLEAELKAMKDEEQAKKNQEQADESLAWANRVSKARELQRKKLEGRAKAKKMSHLNPARLMKLRRLGKL